MESNADFLNLPDEIWSRVLRYLDPEDLLAVENTSARFVRLTHDRTVLRSVRFDSDRMLEEATLRHFFRTPRPTVLSELDLTNCVWAPAAVLEQCIGRCVNLTALRVVGSRLTAGALVQLLETRLQHLELLEWSLLSSGAALGSALRRLESPGNPTCDSLRSMYVELLDGAIHADLMALLLSRCPGLLSVHLHVVASSAEVGGTPRAKPPNARLEHLETLTYSTDVVPGRCPYATRCPLIESSQLWAVLLGKDEDMVQALRTYAVHCGNLSLRLRPRKGRSCVHAMEMLRTESPGEGMPQLCASLDGPDQVAHLRKLAPALDALALQSPLATPPGVDGLLLQGTPPENLTLIHCRIESLSSQGILCSVPPTLGHNSVTMH